MKLVRDIVYDTRHGNALDLYLPQSLSAKACIVFISGQGFQSVRRDDPAAGYFAKELTEAGFAVASISCRRRVGEGAFSQADAEAIALGSKRSRQAGLRLSPRLTSYGYMAAMEDLSTAIGFVRREAENLGLLTCETGVLGVSAGAVAALGLAYPPAKWARRLHKPDAVVAIAGAVAQPWCLDGCHPPCLMFNGMQDPEIDMRDALMAAERADRIGVPLHLVDMGASGHPSIIDGVLDGWDEKGRKYLDMLLGQFEILLPEKAYFYGDGYGQVAASV